MNKQELFDFVAKALLKQGKPSGMATPEKGPSIPFTCLYRGPDNCKCAAGHMIPDDEYDPSFETVTFFGLRDRLGPKTLEAIGGEMNFLMDLQSAHDNAASESFRTEDGDWLGRWTDNMRKTARVYGINSLVFDPIES